MKIILDKVIIHNFLSYGHAEIDLKDKHYCLVSGVNNVVGDNASSNGSGKSSWGSAICYALTGETIGGLKHNLKNINVPEKECWVKLFFEVDNNKYEITRYNEPKSDLKIILNGTDISGKGIKESNAVLNKYLPDLTSQLIGSIIILGQGLPCKFSANTPSGRKEVLEKLSKSDFMIQDLKDRISKRINEVNSELRLNEDKLLVLNTNFKNSEILRVKLANKLAELQVDRDFDKEINTLSELLKQGEISNKKLDENITSLNNLHNTLTTNLTKLNEEKLNELTLENTDFNSFYELYLTKKGTLCGDINALNKRIQEKKNIKDVCPTCGQKIPNVVKPSTEEDEKELDEKIKQLNSIEETYSSNNKEHQLQLEKINSKYKINISDVNTNIFNVKKELAELHSTKKIDLAELSSKLTKIKLEKENYQKTLNELKQELAEIDKEKENLQIEIDNVSKNIVEINNHIKVINQLNTLIKRDFRGYLLKDIIAYINLKVKEYSKIVFGTENLEFSLDGNNINISYSNKAFENLSGGEKTRVDLIIQFALRDMLATYLGFSCNVLILDECLDFLDPVASDAVLNLICNYTNDIESTFIISHHSDELSIPVDYEMVVIKDEKGVSNVTWR